MKQGSGTGSACRKIACVTVERLERRARRTGVIPDVPRRSGWHYGTFSRSCGPNDSIPRRQIVLCCSLSCTGVDQIRLQNWGRTEFRSSRVKQIESGVLCRWLSSICCHVECLPVAALVAARESRALQSAVLEVERPLLRFSDASTRSPLKKWLTVDVNDSGSGQSEIGIRILAPRSESSVAISASAVRRRPSVVRCVMITRRAMPDSSSTSSVSSWRTLLMLIS